MMILDWYRKRPLFWWAIFFSFGIIIQYFQSSAFSILAVVITAMVLLAFFIRSYDILLIILVLIITAGHGSFRLIQTHQTPNNLISQLSESEDKVMYSGTVISLDSTRNGYYYCMTEPYSIYQRQVSARPIQVWLPGLPKALGIGDKITATGVFSEYPRARNPGEFDYRNYQAFKQLYYQFSIEYPWEIKIIPANSASGDRWIEDIRNRVHSIFEHSLSPQSAAFADALILGSRDMVDENLIETYSDLGVIHVMAVSGLHVGFVVLILLIITQIIPIPHRVRVFIVIAGLIFYTWLVDFRPSVMRASTMAALFLIARAYEERSDGLNILGLAALVILFLNPLQLFMLGFQLSFVAVMGIILVYGRMEEVLESRGIQIQQMNPAVKWLAGIILVSLAAFLATIPITAYHFRTVPLYGILVNVLVIPAIGFIVMNLFLVLFAGIFWQPAGAFLAALPDQCIRILNIILEHLRAAGLGAIQIPQFGMEYIFLAYAVLIIFVLWKYSLTKRVALYGVLIGLNLAVLIVGKKTENIRVTFFDVGQADAALIEAPGDVNILVDAGNISLYTDSGTRVLVPYFRYRGIDHLNVAIMSHPHADHIGGLPAILNEIPVEEVWTIRQKYDSKLYKQIVDLAGDQGTPIRYVHAGFDTTIQGLRILTLFPTRNFHNENINNHSIVQKFLYGESSILFPGDMEVEIDEKLHPYNSYLKADLFKVPHHGSITSSSVDLLQLISPDYAVVSVGKNNKFRHPSEEVINRYEEMDIQTLLTRDHGAVIFESDGRGWERIRWR
ncbi:MAG: DNA internalization-related competence protein ComEC/Rec2 [Candidatus Marinimicrobia bacterium]|nr:DNA internalization-related competence protein ComEC/Rec2 [Candidatus Neomarinimicrobiota bacterium]